MSDLHATTTVGSFRSAFARACGPVPAKSPRPVLQNVLMDATDGHDVKLSATDLEIGLVVPVGGIVILSPGRCLLPTRIGSALASLPADDALTIEVKSDKIHLTAKRWKCALQSEDPDLFPAVPGPETGLPFATLAGADLKLAINRTAYALDEESTRFALGGCQVAVNPDDSSLTVVGTDGRRLVKCKVPGEIPAVDGATDAGPATGATPATPAVNPPVMSKRFLSLVARMIDPEAVVELRLDSNRAVIAGQQGWSLFGRLVEGRYPRWQDVFPADHDTVVRATINTAEFLAAVGRVANITASDTSRGIDLDFTEDGLVLSAQSADHGQADDVVGVEYRTVVDGLRAVPEDGVGATMDHRYLAELLKSSAPEVMTFHVIDHRNAITVVGDEGALSSVLMPLTRDR